MSESFSAGGSFTTRYLIARGVTGVDDINDLVFEGFAANVKWRVRERSARGPGLVLDLTPQWTPTNPNSGISQTSYIVEFKGTADLPIIADRLYVGLNGKFALAWTRANGRWIESALLDISGGLTATNEHGSLGLELRRLSGRTLDTRSGRAYFVGPTGSIVLSTGMTLFATWGFQVKGGSRFDTARELDLVSFERHRGLFRLSFPF